MRTLASCTRIAALLAPALLASAPALSATLEVGPGQTYATPCAAIAAASDGDTISIDAAGSYDGDVCAIAKNGLTIRGKNGRAKIDAAGQSAQSKAIWVISGDDTTIEDIEMSGATVSDQNGAAIRQEGANLTLRRCFLHDNENGILAGDNAASEIVIEYSELADNGFGDGQSHNMYINHIAKLTLRHSWSHRAKVGHLVKSRAIENHILYNRLTGEEGTSSYEIDLPNGGLSYVIGNLIEQGPATDNSALVSYAAEGASNPSDALYVVANTFVNDRPSGGTFVAIGASVTTPATLRGNIFHGPGTVCSQATALLEGNFQGDPLFVDAASYDYHLTAGSPCVDAGIDPGSAAGVSLAPLFQYVHAASTEGRTTNGTIDIGAYELGGGAGGGSGATSGTGSMATSGTGGSTATSGSGGSTATSGSGGGTATTSGSGGSLATSGAGGEAPASDGSGDDAGCGCHLAGTRDGGPDDRFPAASVVIGLALAGAVRRRRGRRIA